MSSISSLGQATPTAAATRPGLATASGWLANPDFDRLFIAGTAGLALLTAASLAMAPGLFGVILVADVWLLGYQHVIATFVRMASEADGLKRYRLLLTWAPLAVLVGVVALAAGMGAWTLATVYLYWQWWHYTRQSYGVAQLYRLKTGQPQRSLREMQFVLYLLPLTGILYRSYQQPDRLLGMDLRTLPVPAAAVEIAAGITLLALGWYAVQQWRAWRAGELALGYNLYLVSHLAVFGLGYFAFGSINNGWLVINVWHNTQYLLIVWLFNNKQFKDQVDPARKLLSTLSQRRNLRLYFAATLAVSTAAYVLLGGLVAVISVSALPVALVIYQTINFHHYIVDSQIWKARRPQVRADLGLAKAA